MGHFPGNPVVPGVLILEEVALRAGAVLGPGLRVARLPQVKFLAPLLPEVEAELELQADVAAARVRFRLQHGARLLASGELVFEPE